MFVTNIHKYENNTSCSLGLYIYVKDKVYNSIISTLSLQRSKKKLEKKEKCSIPVVRSFRHKCQKYEENKKSEISRRTEYIQFYMYKNRNEIPRYLILSVK